ncbi:type II secretion system protein GspH [Aminobacter sp. Y103A]|uniref:GspH/FimT family pseudopilin n=1 Tax=Aminobacter sp. Y103A TaxID=1870862 RepID=UPI0025728E72|nr:GspH/FimT family pseudopilin [Aminobacter sp. SS-2016]BBD40256.1 type II secretion system protein GspH [Aminobacter sp. SS-2016]
MTIPTFVKAGNEEGFTLVELLVALAIVALVAALAFPSIQASSRSQNAETISREIVSRLRVSRTMAIARASPQSIVIAPGARQIRFPDSSLLSIPQEVELTIVTGQETVRAESEAVLAFLPNGSATGADLFLKDAASEVKIEVNWLTGLSARRRVR